jgi:Raf kinase inhibitor-like YbhB/YbcL family protein
LLAVLTVAALGTLAACSHDGRELRPPSPDQTLSVVTTSTTVAPATIDSSDPGVGTLMALRAPFDDGGRIDPRFTCKGQDVSPPLSWENVPDGTEELAISVIDLDSNPPGFVHWAITGVDPASSGLSEGATPEGALQAKNGFGSVGWKGPCPPSGEHTYLFTLYALDSSPEIIDGQDGQAAIDAFESRQIASVAVAGVFGSAA